MKIEHIREFVVLAESKSYANAAKKLYISTSALSRHIVALEEDIGTQLMERTTHHVELTEMGREAYRVLRKMLASYDGLLETAKNYNNRADGKLQLGMLYFAINDYFSDLIPYFKKTYPSITVGFGSYQPHELYRDVLTGKADIGLLWSGNLPDADLIRFHSLRKERFVVMLAEGHPLADREELSLSELADEVSIELEEDFCSTVCLHDALAQCGFVFAKTMRASNVEEVPYVIKVTNAVCLAGAPVVNQRSPGIRYIPISDEKMHYTSAFIYRVDNKNPAIPIFLKTADEAFRKLSKR